MPVMLTKCDGRYYLFVFGDGVRLEDVLRVVERAGCRDYSRIVVLSDKKNRELARRLKWALALGV